MFDCTVQTRSTYLFSSYFFSGSLKDLVFSDILRLKRALLASVWDRWSPWWMNDIVIHVEAPIRSISWVFLRCERIEISAFSPVVKGHGLCGRLQRRWEWTDSEVTGFETRRRSALDGMIFFFRIKSQNKRQNFPNLSLSNVQLKQTLATARWMRLSCLLMAFTLQIFMIQSLGRFHNVHRHLEPL